MMITGSPGRRSLTLASSSMPEPPGMRMSLTSTCGSSPLVQRRQHVARVGEAAHREVCSRASAFSSTKRMDWSSSTIQMGFMRRGCARQRRFRLKAGDHDLEHRPARFAVAFDRALVLLHEGLRQREPEPEPPSRPDTSG
jgi:hypothetical protein